MKRVYKYRVVGTDGTPRSAFSSQYRSLNACLKAVAEYRGQCRGAFNRPDDRIQIQQFIK